ncbi:unnamed protein product [Sphenostylis stenocarpa]|uniref:WAT1-related protein n=1 Tax=Sphenostylis stenocarpa TaxID=92480 RepID=A0AA86RTQ8_9FABA|nr:unnamed protein product [Sphenostylis stenocarpa]
MGEKINAGCVEDVAIIGGLIGVQFVYAGNATSLPVFIPQRNQSHFASNGNCHAKHCPRTYLHHRMDFWAFALGDFPAPMSLGAMTSLCGAFMTATVQLLEHHKLKTGWLLAGAVGGICLSFNGWALKKKGPVFVSMFSPIGTVLSVIFSVVTLGESISIGSAAGMILMFTGLYFVLWAKGKEGLQGGDCLESEFDVERPLLS